MEACEAEKDGKRESGKEKSKASEIQACVFETRLSLQYSSLFPFLFSRFWC
jgi:hypothetical protein